LKELEGDSRTAKLAAKHSSTNWNFIDKKTSEYRRSKVYVALAQDHCGESKDAEKNWSTALGLLQSHPPPKLCLTMASTAMR